MGSIPIARSSSAGGGDLTRALGAGAEIGGSTRCPAAPLEASRLAPESPTPWLDGKHTVFGQVTAGMDVVDRICEAERDENDRPASPVAIERIELPEGP